MVCCVLIVNGLMFAEGGDFWYKKSLDAQSFMFALHFHRSPPTFAKLLLVTDFIC